MAFGAGVEEGVAARMAAVGLAGVAVGRRRSSTAPPAARLPHRRIATKMPMIAPRVEIPARLRRRAEPEGIAADDGWEAWEGGAAGRVSELCGAAAGRKV